MAQGRALREQVRRAFQILQELEAFRLLKPQLVPFALFRWLATRRAHALWRNRLAGDVPEMAERLRGMAAAADVSLPRLHLLNILEPLMADLRDQTGSAPLGGCSAIAITGERAAEGEPVIARNFDYLPAIQPLYVMRDTRPEGRLRSLDFTAAPLAGAVDGMNEAGLCITDNYAFVRDDPSHTRTISMAVSETLARCTTVAEAANYLMSGRRWGGGILMLADASGDIASLELSNRSSALRRPAAGEDLLFHSNRFQVASMRDAELAPEACYTKRAPVPLRGLSVHRSADVRDERFAHLVSDGERIDPGDLLRIMADHGPDGTPSHESLCVHSDYWFTTATLQFFPCSRRVRVAFDSACRAQLIELSFDRGAAPIRAQTNEPSARRQENGANDGRRSAHE